MALPGIKVQKIKDKGNLVRKCRYYNYELLRTITNTDQLYKTRNLGNTPTDKLFEMCNRQNVSLRLLCTCASTTITNQNLSIIVNRENDYSTVKSI